MNPVIAEIIRQGRRQPRRRRRYTNTALRISRVETGHRNLPGGDADSYGFRQQRESIYGRQGLRRQVSNLFHELAAADRGQTKTELAADVQRPAAQYRGRYGLPAVRREARRITSRAFGGAGVAGASATPGTMSGFQRAGVQLGRTSSFDRAGYEQARRRSLVGDYLRQQGHGGGVLFRTGLLGGPAPNQADFTSSRLTSKLTSGTTPRLLPGGNFQNGRIGPASGQVQTAIHAARKRLGVTEVGSSNTGPQVDRWERKFGFHAAPWCGIFLGTVLRRAGVQGITGRVASVAAIEEDAKQGANGFASWHSARAAHRGDALVTNQGAHVVFVTGVNRKRGLIHTIGGNSGGAVRRVTYRMDAVHGVARPRYQRR